MDSPASHDPTSRILPLKPADFHILMVLLRGDLHGYGLMQQVREDSEGMVELEVGSLYRLIGRLTDLGLLEESPQPPAAGDVRRRYYRITALGRRAAEQEARRLVAVLRLARSRNLLPAPASS